jgi:CelD/BcsL family acetyltransferase involved in cellulose biosynthesis
MVPMAELSTETLALEDPRWLAFVSSVPSATPFHHPAWAGLLAECYGFSPFALAVTHAGTIVGGAPVLEVTGLGRSRRWVALPFTDALPLLAWGAGPEAVAGALERTRVEAGIGSLEVRGSLVGIAGHEVQAGVVHRLPLSKDPEAVFRTFKKSQVQGTISKAQREGATIRRGHVNSDLTRVFFDLHVETRRRQGVPVQPRRYFELLWSRMLEAGLGFVLLAYAGERPVAGAVFLDWNGTVVYKLGASDPAFWKLRPNNLLLWTAIKEACEQGRGSFDFGRSDADNAGLRHFKSGWGTSEEPLAYSVLGERGGGPAGHGRLGVAMSACIRRSPAFVCRALGELFYRYAA